MAHRQDDQCVGTSKYLVTLFEIWGPQNLIVPELIPMPGGLQGFFLLLQRVAEIEERLVQWRSRVERYHYTVQPVPVILLQDDEVQQRSVCFDTFRWQFSSVNEVVLGTSKILIALSLLYPPESRHLWLFLQRTFFEVDTDVHFLYGKGLKYYPVSYVKQYGALASKLFFFQCLVFDLVLGLFLLYWVVFILVV